MIRLRSQKLLSGVSTLAMLAAFGMADPVLAGQTITAAGNPNPPVTNAAANSDDFIEIQSGAVVTANGSGVSILNAGTLTSYLLVDNGILQGGITNTGTIQGDGVAIINGSFINGNFLNSGSITAPTGVLVGDSVIDGGISNSGLIDATLGIVIDNSTILGNVTNSGSIGAGSTGIGVDASTITGSIQNTGDIESYIGIYVNDSVVTDGIQNTGAASSIVGTRAGILLEGNTTLLGGITNGGTITAGSTTAWGIRADGGTVNFIGDLTNTGLISVGGSTAAAISLDVNTFVGTLTNDGTLSVTGSNVAGIALEGGNFVGNLVNTGTIEANGATAAGVRLSGGAFIGNIQNTGTISGNDHGILLDGADFTGTILNDEGGLITATSTSGIALHITAGAFTGDIVNSGQILADTSSGQGIVIDGTATFSGNITNTATGAIFAESTGILIANATFTGDVTNDGSISTSNSDAIRIATTASFVGNVVNNGVIAFGATTGVGGNGISIDTPDFTGDVTNSATGLILADDTGIEISSATLLTGNVTNVGTISAESSGIVVAGTITGDLSNDGLILANQDFGSSGNGMEITGLVQGTVFNTGTISAINNNGIRVNGGEVVGGIENSGTITGEVAGIDISAAAAAMTITQTDGLIQGNDTGTVTTALNLDNGNADVFNGDGGVLDGDVIVDGDDDFIMTPTDTFAWLRGSTTGTIDEFNMLGSGVALLGTSARGVDGDGVQATAATMALSGGGTLYIDDDSQIDITGALTQAPANTMEFHVSWKGAAEQSGQITAGSATITNSLVAAYIDPATLAISAIPTTQTLVFDDVLDAGALTGTFSNSGDILTSSIFFEGIAQYDGDGTVDLIINRLAFNDAIAAVTQNQIAVGGALEEIYDNVALSPEFVDLFEEIFGGSATQAEAQAILDELHGAEHAQIQQVSLNLSNNFANLVQERLDATLLSTGSARMSALAGQQYADAGTAASDGAVDGPGSHGLNRGPSGASVWLRGYGQWTNVDTDPEADGYDQDSNGLIGGVDFALGDRATIGGAVSYTDTEVEFDEPGDQADLESWQGGLYANYGIGSFYIDGVASYAQHDVGAQRVITLPSISHLATSSYDATTWSVAGEVGTIWRLGRVNMQPSAALGYTNADIDGFDEVVLTAPGIGLSVQDTDADSLASTLALRASGQWMVGFTRMVPDIKVGWRHEFDDDRDSFTANFLEDLSSGAAFTVVSSEVQQDSLVVSTGLTAGVSRNFEVFFDINGQYNADASSTNASGGLRFTW